MCRGNCTRIHTVLINIVVCKILVFPRRRQLRGRFLPLFVCVSVCFFPHDVSKTDVARITKLDVEMIEDESWKTIHFGLKGQRSRVTKTLPACVFCTLVIGGFFWSSVCLFSMKNYSKMRDRLWSQWLPWLPEYLLLINPPPARKKPYLIHLIMTMNSWLCCVCDEIDL